MMTVNSLLHFHDLADNPLSYPRHQQVLNEYQALIYTARKHHIAVISYLESRRVFKAEELKLILTFRKYYNFLQKSVSDIAQPETINALLMKFYEAGFVYKTYVQVEENEEDNVVKKQMIQL